MTGPANRMTFAAPAPPSVYTWEATDEQVAERYGIPVRQVVRFDLNTSPAPPDLVARILARGRFETSLSEYPPSDYRRLAAAAAARYGVEPSEILVGAGADEVLDMLAKAFLPPGGSAVVPTPTYAMYRVVSEQRTGRVVAVPRLGPEDGYALDLAATRAAARTADLVWLCSPNNPTGRSEPAGAIERLLADLSADAAADGRTPPAAVLDEAYAEFTGTSLLPLRRAYPRLVVVRTLSKAYALAGLRVGFAIAERATLAEIEPYRPPGSVSTISVTVATEALLQGDSLAGNLERVVAERGRLTAALERAGWRPGPSETNFLLVAFDDAAAAASAADALLRRGLVPRTFPDGHPLADHLRITVRSPEEDDRLIAAVEAAPSGPTRRGS